MFSKKVITDEHLPAQTIEIEELLTRRIKAIFQSGEEAEKRLKEGKKLRIYLGIDPTGPNLHLGHTIPLLFLKQLLELGHKPVLLIGDFTARIGDPTGKESARSQLTEKEVKKNMENYLEQVYKILPKDSFEVKHNSVWLSKMLFQDVVELASYVTVQQMIQRDMFQRRIRGEIVCLDKETGLEKGRFNPPLGFISRFGNIEVYAGKIECSCCGSEIDQGEIIYGGTKSGLHKVNAFPMPIYLNEFLYPLMQGYDSVAMKIDGEVGGNDQTFNMLVGRDLERKMLNKDKLVFATRLLIDAESGKKMSKTEGGLISLSDSPQDMFGKTMKTVPDEMTALVFLLCTEKQRQWIDGKKGNDPYGFKKELAYELVRMYHGEKEAQKAGDEWERVFSKGELPGEMEEVKKTKLVELVGLATQGSSSSAKILIEQGAVRLMEKSKRSGASCLKKGM